MRNLSTGEREEALKYMALVELMRHREGKSEEKTATELGFSSPQRMYQRMKELECPDWAVYPEPPKPKRRAQGKVSAAEELPVTDAVDLLKAGVENLTLALEEVPYLKQWLKDGRFVGQLVYTKESGRVQAVYRKEAYTEAYGGALRDYWEVECKRHGYDPDEVEEFHVTIERVVDRGAARHPDVYLVWLVAAYVMTGEPLEPLLRQLHPPQNTPDRGKIEEKRDALLRAAQLLATALLGGPVKAGAPQEPISPDDQEAARLLQWAKRQGAIDERGGIVDARYLPQELRNLGPEETLRLLKLRLPDARER